MRTTRAKRETEAGKESAPKSRAGQGGTRTRRARQGVAENSKGAPKVVVVDGSNVAYAEPTQKGQPKVSNLIAIRRALQRKGLSPVIIVDASLRHKVDDPEQLQTLIGDLIVRQAPAGTDADYFILETADREKAQIISNDEYASYRKRYPWINQRRVPLMIVNGQVELYGDKL